LPLPPPSPRQHLHNRDVSYRGYRREDGGWDIEAELRDSKTQDIQIVGESLKPAGEAIHHMLIRMTLDEQLVVKAMAVAMDGIPHGNCIEAESSLQKMVGVQVGGGWRKNIEQRIGGIQGCTHLRELLFNMATVTFQTCHPGEAILESETPPKYLGQCQAWDTRGPLVQRIMPRFYQWDINRNPTLKD
jgi:hypothetical protein